MSNKLIDLNALSSYKTQSDLKYQDKLTAGNNITISGNTISAQTTFGQQTLYNATITLAGWSGTSNAVTVQGISAGDDVEIVGVNPTGLTDLQIQTARENLNFITYGTTSANTITFYALDGLPSADIPVTIRQLLNTNVTTRTYSAGDSISLNNGVISATPVFENGHSSYSGGSSTAIPANSTTTAYTATRNCKFYFSIQCQGTDSSAKTCKVYLNNVEVYSQYTPVTTKYTRIIHGALILSSGDVVKIENPYGFAFEVPQSIFYE
jgi:hypothetical protein